MKKILTILCLVFFIHAHPQDTITYKPGVLYRDGKHWKLNDKKLKKREVRNEINTVPASAAFNKKARTLETISAISSMAGLACLLLNPRKVGQYPYRKDNGLILPTVVFYGTGFYLFFRSIGLRKKASNAYFEHHKIIY